MMGVAWAAARKPGALSGRRAGARPDPGQRDLGGPAQETLAAPSAEVVAFREATPGAIRGFRSQRIGELLTQARQDRAHADEDELARGASAGGVIQEEIAGQSRDARDDLGAGHRRFGAFPGERLLAQDHRAGTARGCWPSPRACCSNGARPILRKASWEAWLPGSSSRARTVVSWGLGDFRDCRALVLVFMCNHCPYVKAVRGRISGLAAWGQEQASGRSGRGQFAPMTRSNTPRLFLRRCRERSRALSRADQFPLSLGRDPVRRSGPAGAGVHAGFLRLRQSDPAPERSAEAQSSYYRGAGRLTWRDEFSGHEPEDLKAELEEILAGREPSSDQIPSMWPFDRWRRKSLDRRKFSAHVAERGLGEKPRGRVPARRLESTSLGDRAAYLGLSLRGPASQVAGGQGGDGDKDPGAGCASSDGGGPDRKQAGGP